MSQNEFLALYRWRRAGLNPRSLFLNGEQGFILNPRPPYLYTTSAGTTPVAADGEAFGLELDSRFGGARGPEINDDPGLPFRVYRTDSENVAYQMSGAVLEAGKIYDISYRVSENPGTNAASFRIAGSSANLSPITTISAGFVGEASARFQALSGGAFALIGATAGADLTLAELSVKELVGNHASQPTSANRPVYKTLNGRHWSQFNGTNQFLDTGKTRIGNTGLFCGPGEQFCLAVVYRGAAGASGQIVSRSSATGSADSTFRLNLVNGNLGVVARGSANSDVVVGAANGAWRVCLLDWDGDALTYMHDSLTPASLSVGSVAEESTARILIGARTASSPTGFLNGDIGPRILVDESQPLAKRQQIMRSLARQYGISLAA